MSDDKVCEKSPDKKHHYVASSMQSLVYIPNGSHTCMECHYCKKQRCKTFYFPVIDPLTYPTDEDLDKE